jgi:hypothetical protein
MKRSFVAFVCLLVASIATSARADFINPSFETGDTTGWTIGGNAEYGVARGNTPITGTAIPGNYVLAIDGSYALWAKLSATIPPTTISFSQNVDVAPGRTYSAGFRYGTYGSGTIAESRSFSISLNGVTRLSAVGTGSHVGGITGYAASWTAGPNVTTATVLYQMSGSTNGNLAGFTFDQFSFRWVPEPAGVFLLLLPLALVRRRHRHR